MYTQCPDCQTAFRVTAQVLQQAAGRVRCGGCGNAFNALSFLTEEQPASAGAAAPVEPHTEEQRQALLKTLEELAGPAEVRIEDTGVEWRVMDEDIPDDEADTVAREDEPPELAVVEKRELTRTGEMRFDDNTPLPDDFGEEEEESYVPPETPQRRATDVADEVPDNVDEVQVDLALAEPGEWEDLLDEVDEATKRDIPLEVEEELAAIHNELSSKPPPQEDVRAEPLSDDSIAERILRQEELVDLTGDAPAEQADEAPAGEDVEEDAGETAEPVSESTGEFEEQIDVARQALLGDEEEQPVELSLMDDGHAAGPEPRAAEPVVPPQTEEEMTVNMEIDEQLMQLAEENEDRAAAMIEDPESLFDEDSPHVETIIMEGDFVRGSLQEERPAADEEPAPVFEDPGFLADTYALNRGKLRGGRRSTDPAGFGVIAAVIVLALVFVAQIVHESRETLSTYGAFNQTIGPVYRLIGNPVTPEWDIAGWQFQATNGATDENEEVLTIFSRIVNRSEQPLPYPLVHVSLTDRWEEIIGSRVLEPGEYLAGDLDPRKPVLPGENFTAVITIASPSAEATGFKLNVCYRVSAGRVRCATEDFKD